MFEKVNPSHSDKKADRIAGALVDMAYSKNDNPGIAVEVLLGHGICHIIAETSERLDAEEINKAVYRISGIANVDYKEYKKDRPDITKCDDNGTFKGLPLTNEQKRLSNIARDIYKKYPSKGKYIINEKEDIIVIYQSNTNGQKIDTAFKNTFVKYSTDNGEGVGATNRKLGSDLGDALTGGGIHGKDLSKADVAVNIYAHLKAQKEDREVKIFCIIGEGYVDNKPYGEIVKIAKDYIKSIGGFEKFAEWGLI